MSLLLGIIFVESLLIEKFYRKIIESETNHKQKPNPGETEAVAD
jgi:hypothetical protein